MNQHQDQHTPKPSKTTTTAFDNAQKQRRGIVRIAYAGWYSLQGLWYGFTQAAAFRTECFLALIMLPAACWVGRDWQGIALLWAVTVLVLIAEMLNTAVEVIVDKVSPEWSEAAKIAKDTGSAAVFLAMLLCAAVWGMALYEWWNALDG